MAYDGLIGALQLGAGWNGLNAQIEIAAHLEDVTDLVEAEIGRPAEQRRLRLAR